MKKSLTWRLFILVAGTLFGLMAGMGLAAPAVASPVQAATAADHRDNSDLDLKANGHGRYIDLKVVGSDYDAKRVNVKVVQLNNNGRHRVVDDRTVWTDRGGDFRYQVREVKCGNTYQAYSYSRQDGWDRSDTIRIRCDRNGYYE